MSELPDHELDRLIRLAAAEDPDWKRPSDASIEAYVRGDAPPTQEAEVRAALLGSAAFRDELAAMSFVQYDADRFEAAAAPPLAARRAGPLDEPPPAAHRPVRVAPRPWLLRPRNSVGLAAAAGIIIVAGLLARDAFPPPHDRDAGEGLRAELILDRTLDPAQFRGGVERGTHPPAAAAATTPTEAAVERFLTALSWESDRFTARAPEPVSRPGPGDRAATVRLLRPDGREIRACPFTLPASTQGIEATILLVPSLELYRAGAPAPVIRIVIDPALAEMAIVTLAGRTDAGPVAAPATVVQLR